MIIHASVENRRNMCPFIFGGKRTRLFNEAAMCESDIWHIKSLSVGDTYVDKEGRCYELLYKVVNDKRRIIYLVFEFK